MKNLILIIQLLFTCNILSLELKIQTQNDKLGKIDIKLAEKNLLVDVSDKFYRVRNQGNTFLCHSFAVADILDEFYGLKKLNQSVSAFGLALDTVVFNRNGINVSSEYDKAVFDRTGIMGVTLFSHFYSQAVGEKLCFERNLPSEDLFGQNSNFLREHYNFDHMLNNYFQELENISEKNKLKEKCSNFLNINQVSFEQFVNLIYEKVYDPSNQYKPSFENQLKFAEDTMMLLKYNRPVLLSYDVYSILYGKRRSELGGHISILTGYGKLPSGDLFFKLRHSYGHGCKLNSNSKIPNCKDGYQYILFQDLAPHVDRITSLRATYKDYSDYLKNQK